MLRLILNEVSSVKAEQRALRRDFQDRFPELVLTKSPDQLGIEQLQFVRENNLIRGFIPTVGSAVLSEDENNDVIECQKESKLQEFICGKLQKLVQGRVVARSDDDGWLETVSKNKHTMLKPDALIINKAFLKEKIDGSSQLRGIPAHKSLFYGTDLVDFKLVNSSHAFGELVNHLQHLYANALAFNKESPFVVRGALAHKKGIELVTLSRGNVVHLESLSWTAGGSAGRLSEFFSEEKNPIALALNELLEKSKLILYDKDDCRFRTRFLGLGGTGSVFWVDRSKSSMRRGMALKVATGTNNVVRLKWEFLMNQKVAERASDVIVKATEIFISNTQEAAGLLMEEVGREVELTDLERALDALASLHKAGFCHGDARRQNLLVISRTLKWCDLQCALDISESGNEVKMVKISQDILTLVKSFGKELDNPLDETLLKNYVSDVSAENLRALLKTVLNSNGQRYPDGSKHDGPRNQGTQYS